MKTKGKTTKKPRAVFENHVIVSREDIEKGSVLDEKVKPPAALAIAQALIDCVRVGVQTVQVQVVTTENRSRTRSETVMVIGDFDGGIKDCHIIPLA